MDTAQISGHLIILMAPMGSGKGTLIRLAKEKYPYLYDTVSCTTRDKRPGEEHGKQYYFLSEAEFDERIAAGDFIEWAVFGKNKYGTLKDEIIPKLADGHVVICEIEVQGVEQLLKLLPREHITLVYLDAGGWEVLKQRALARAPMSEEELKARHERFLVEREAKPLADIVIDNSGTTIDAAFDQFSKVVDESHKKCRV